MKEQIISALEAVIDTLKNEDIIPAETSPKINLDRTKDASHGDFATNLALVLAKPAKKAPRQIAEIIIPKLEAALSVEKIEIAGPGFINFFVGHAATTQVVSDVLEQAEKFGHHTVGAGKKIQVEFVSANPTGPLHVGHGRGAAYGAAVSDLLEAVGYDVDREYYVNDAGRQMDILATSVWLRYLEANNVELLFPSNGYKGQYVYDIAAQLKQEINDGFVHSVEAVFTDIPADEPAGGDKELHIDGLIHRAKTLLGEESYRKVFDLGLNSILDDIRDDLAGFGVNYQKWYSERSLTERNLITTAMDKLKAAGYIYEKSGAQWFRSTDFGDEKDRVVIRENGQATYFASDIAYHFEKLERGYDEIIDVWGADHHGYVPRVRAALTAQGQDPEKLTVLLVQFAILYRGKERAQMSTRSGEFVTLRQLREEVGSDAARFFYVMRKCEQHLDFDLDLAKSQSNDNPLYYIQYAHARIATVFGKLAEQSLSWDKSAGEQNLAMLTESHEEQLIRQIAAFPDRVKRAALTHEPHQVAQFLKDFAGDFHAYYNAHRFIDAPSDELRNARFTLIAAVQQVLKNGLSLLGVSAPDAM